MNFKRRHKIKYKQTPHCSSSASCSVHSVVSVAPVSISAASSKFVSVICFSVVVVVVAAAAYFFFFNISGSFHVDPLFVAIRAMSTPQLRGTGSGRGTVGRSRGESVALHLDSDYGVVLCALGTVCNAKSHKLNCQQVIATTTTAEVAAAMPSSSSLGVVKRAMTVTL